MCDGLYEKSIETDVSRKKRNYRNASIFKAQYFLDTGINEFLLHLNIIKEYKYRSSNGEFLLLL